VKRKKRKLQTEYGNTDAKHGSVNDDWHACISPYHYVIIVGSTVSKSLVWKLKSSVCITAATLSVSQLVGLANSCNDETLFWPRYSVQWMWWSFDLINGKGYIMPLHWRENNVTRLQQTSFINVYEKLSVSHDRAVCICLCLSVTLPSISVMSRHVHKRVVVSAFVCPSVCLSHTAAPTLSRSSMQSLITHVANRKSTWRWRRSVTVSYFRFWGGHLLIHSACGQRGSESCQHDEHCPSVELHSIDAVVVCWLTAVLSFNSAIYACQRRRSMVYEHPIWPRLPLSNLTTTTGSRHDHKRFQQRSWFQLNAKQYCTRWIKWQKFHLKPGIMCYKHSKG